MNFGFFVISLYFNFVSLLKFFFLFFPQQRMIDGFALRYDLAFEMWVCLYVTRSIYVFTSTKGYGILNYA